MGSAGLSRSADAPVIAVSGGIVYRRGLFQRLDKAARVIEVSAPAGSGKTVLLRSWIGQSGLQDRAGWVPVQRGERDPQPFWSSVTDALLATAPGSTLVRPVSAAPDLDGWLIVERLLEDLASLADRVWLVIDDVHELRSAAAQRQLELLIMRAPPSLRFVLATRHDVRLGLHRLRLEGELTEIRAADLRFTVEEAQELLETAGVELSEPTLARLHERTEGWAAGLRLAALSLAGHPDPEGFVAGFSGSERTVADYLLAEVLERQPRQVRRLLLRTSPLERVNGELADLLTGRSGGGRILQELEQANAFVVSLDAARTWFRYHRLFADLLQLELRATAPDELTGLHAAAASWFAGHGFAVEAVRHAQAAGDWKVAAHVLADHWLALALNGQGGTAHELLAGFPAGVIAADAELTLLWAAGEIYGGSMQDAQRHLTRAAAGSESVPADRRVAFRVLLAVQRLRLAQKRADLPAAAEEAEQLLALAEAADAWQYGLGEDMRAVALVSLGTAELLSQRLGEAERHLEQGIALARGIGRPFVEVTGLAQWARVAIYRSLPLAVERGTQAIDVAQQHGWSEQPVLSAAYTVLATVTIWRGQLEEGQRWLRDAERTLRAEAEPATGLLLHHARGALELARGRYTAALDAFRAAGQQAELLISPHSARTQMRGLLLQALLRVGDIGSVEQALAEMDDRQRDTGEMRNVAAALRLARDDPQGALHALRPVLDGSAPVIKPIRVGAFLKAAIARDAADDPAAAEDALERALDLAEPDGLVLPFLIDRAPGVLERRLRHGTAHAALAAQIRAALTRDSPGGPEGFGGTGSRVPGGSGGMGGPGMGGPGRAGPPGRDSTEGQGGIVGPETTLLEPLSETEMRVLRYLPTNLTTREIGGELYLSANTIKTHIRHLYLKLGAHRRGEAVQLARAMGLLAPSPRRY